MTPHTLATTTHGRYLVAPPVEGAAAGLLVGFHGYGQHAGRMLEDLDAIAGTARWQRVSVQALHRFYDRRTQQVVACWMTREDRELAIADNVAYVAAVVAAVSRANAAPTPLVYVGFSQGVAMAFRAAARAGHRCHGVIALGGDVPPDVREMPGLVLPKVLIGGGTGDPYYPPATFDADVEWLADRGVLAASIAFSGSHEWSDVFRRAVSGFLAHLAPPPPAPEAVP